MGWGGAEAAESTDVPVGMNKTAFCRRRSGFSAALLHVAQAVRLDFLGLGPSGKIMMIVAVAVVYTRHQQHCGKARLLILTCSSLSPLATHFTPPPTLQQNIRGLRFAF
jgi:hypothetical protein